MMNEMSIDESFMTYSRPLLFTEVPDGFHLNVIPSGALKSPTLLPIISYTGKLVISVYCIRFSPEVKGCFRS